MLPISTLSGIIAQQGTPSGGNFTVGAQFTTLSITSLSGSGARPFSATVLPLRSQVPSGSTVSTADGTGRSSILSTWDDGSASVVILSGTTNGTGTIPVCTATGSDTGVLSVSAITAQVTSISVAFGAPYGTASITDFSSPERVWWSNSQTICARYRVQPPTLSGTQLECVIDVQAWGDRAMVEIVVENGKFDAAASTSSTSVGSASYASAVVSVNGTVLATVSSSVFAEGNHGGHRAWYVSNWIGGNPGLRVTQSNVDLQKHPLLFKCDQVATFNMSTYTNDTYSPGSTGRHRATNMGGTGDDATIGPIPEWESHALQSGDYRAWNATEVSVLAILSYNINHRDVSGVVPYSAIMPQKCQGSFWRNWPRNTAEPAFETAHQPAAGLMAFVARPSPVYIEIAQKIAVWTGTVDSTRDILSLFDAAGQGVTDSTGIVGNSQIRARAWGPRNIAHATFITPGAHLWRAGGLEWLDRNTRFMNAFRVNSRGTLLPHYEGYPDGPEDLESGMSGIQVSMWMYHFCVAEWHKIASSYLLASVSSARQTAVDTVADALALAVVKWVTEQPNGGWRFLPYRTRVGDTSGNMATYTTWTAQRSADLTGSPSSTAGLFGGGIGNETTWASVEAGGFETTALQTTTYAANFVAALGASVERNILSATTAWTTVVTGITNWNTWRGTFATSPKWGAYPRVNVPVIGFGSGSDTGSISSDIWTPGRDSFGIINQASWNTVPTGRWIEVAGTRLDSLDSIVKAAVPGWQDYGNSRWVGVTNAWNGICIDATNARAWYIATGGHSDSSNNGIYRFDGFKMAYTVERLPSNSNRWSAGYISRCTASTSTGCQESSDAYSAEITAGTWNQLNHWFYDEIYWDNPAIDTSSADVGVPTARHVYHGVAYLPDRNELVMASRRVWRYSLTTGKWTSKSAPDNGLGEEIILEYDQSRSRLTMISCGSGGPWGGSYDLTTDTWGGNAMPGYGWDWDHAAPCRNGDEVTIIKTADPTSSSPKVGQYIKYNVTTGTTIASGLTQYSGGLADSSFAPGWDGESAVYIPTLNRYWVTRRMSSGVYEWLEMDPTTTPWTMSRKTFTNTPPTPIFCAHAMYIPSMDAVVYLSQADQNILIYKISA